MQIGLVGLGRMGAGMAQRLAHGGVDVVAYDQTEEARRRYPAGNFRSASHPMDHISNRASGYAASAGRRR